MAFIDKIGGRENFDSILRSEVSIGLREINPKIIDKNGRAVPLPDLRFTRDGTLGLQRLIENPKKKFKIVQPAIKFAERLQRLVQFFPGMTFMSIDEFQNKSYNLLEQLREHSTLTRLLNGVWLPVCYPQLKLGDYGEDLENIFLNAVAGSFEEHFPTRKFENYCEGELKGAVKVVDDGHDRFLEKIADGPLVGIQFFPFQGFSVFAAREQMNRLSEALFLPSSDINETYDEYLQRGIFSRSVCLSGAIDIATTLTAYPELLAHCSGSCIAGYDCAATSLKSPTDSLCFVVDKDNFRLAENGHLDAHSSDSSGLVFIGS